MPTSSNSSITSFASSLLRFWRSPISHPVHCHSAQKPRFAANERGHSDDRGGVPSCGHQFRGRLLKVGCGHKRKRHTAVSDNPPPPPLSLEEEQASLNNFARAFRRQMEHLSDSPPAQPVQMETILEAPEESEGSIVEISECHCESVYHTPTSLEFDLSDIPHFLNFTPEISPQVNDPPTRDGPSPHHEMLLLQEELEGIKRENQDLNAELAECYDYGRSLRELEIRYEHLLEEVTGSNKLQRTLTQNMSFITENLRNAMHSRVTLEREADQLRWIIHYYQASIEDAGITLAYQDEINKHVSSLDFPLQPPPVASYQAGDAEGPSTIAESGEGSDSCLTLFLQKSNYIATPPKTPNLRRMKSHKPPVFSPLAPKWFRSESPIKRDYIPQEGSPLKFESRLLASDEEESMDKLWLQSEVPSNGRISRLDYAEDERLAVFA